MVGQISSRSCSLGLSIYHILGEVRRMTRRIQRYIESYISQASHAFWFNCDRTTCAILRTVKYVEYTRDRDVATGTMSCYLEQSAADTCCVILMSNHDCQVCTKGRLMWLSLNYEHQTPILIHQKLRHHATPVFNHTSYIHRLTGRSS